MALNINFVGRTQCEGNYVNFDPQIQDKTKISLRMKFWKDKDTRNAEGMLPFNDQMAGGRTERIVGFDCIEECDYDLTSPLNIFQQGYEYLKTLEKFAGATDDFVDDQSAQLDIIKTTALNLQTQFSNINKKVGL